jgi:hypothetical protein
LAGSAESADIAGREAGGEGSALEAEGTNGGRVRPEDAGLSGQAVNALKGAGVWPQRARALVKRFGPEKALHALTVFEATGAKKVKTSRGAYLAEIVETGNSEELSEMADWLEGERGEGQPSLLGDAAETRQAGEGGEAEVPLIPEDPAAAELFELVLEDAGEEIDQTSRRVWFGQVYATGAVGERLTVAVPSGFAREYVQTRFAQAIGGALRERAGEEWRLEVVVGERA